VTGCIFSSVSGSFPEALHGWTYTPKMRAEAQFRESERLSQFDLVGQDFGKGRNLKGFSHQI
jgi:hypothetical protein